MNRGAKWGYGTPQQGNAIYTWLQHMLHHLRPTGRAALCCYEDVAGFCRSAPLAEIAQHDHVFTPGRYVGAEEVEDDDEAFAKKMQRLTLQLGEQMKKGAEPHGCNAARFASLA